MNNLEFIRPIKIRKKWLYEEEQYKEKLQNYKNTYEQQLLKTNELLDKTPKEEVSIIKELKTIRIHLHKEIIDLKIHIEYCNERIKHYQTISKINIPLG